MATFAETDIQRQYMAVSGFGYGVPRCHGRPGWSKPIQGPGGGFLLAVPQGAFADAALSAKLQALPEEMIGQSTFGFSGSRRKSVVGGYSPTCARAWHFGGCPPGRCIRRHGQVPFSFRPGVHHLDALLPLIVDNVLVLPMPDQLSAAAW